MLRLFDCLETEPNVLFRDSYREGGRSLSASEQALLRQYRGLSLKGRETVRSVVDALCAYRDEVEETGPEKQEPRVIPLYRNPAAAGYASPVFGEDFDYIPVTEDIPQAAEFAVRISGDSMAPYIADGSVVYVNRDPLREGDVGIFCVDGDLFCKQYYKDPAGVVYLFSLNRKRADADVILPPSAAGALCASAGSFFIRCPCRAGIDSHTQKGTRQAPRPFFACSVLICCDYDAVKLRGALGICLGLPRNIQRLQNLFKIRLLHGVARCR